MTFTPHSLRVGVLGASGFTGREACRLLRDHPDFELAFATSRAHAGTSLRTLDPAAPHVALSHPDAVDLSTADVVLLCLPHGASAPAAQRCLEAGLRVVDLSGDLRLRSEDLHRRIYASPRPQGLAGRAVYGLTELAAADLPEARLVANPGCYPTCAALALAPLAAAGRLGHAHLVVNAVSGVSGAGAEPTARSHFCSAADDVRPYKIGRAHRHVAEIEQTLATLAPAPAPAVIFTPHLVPLQRGLLTSATLQGSGLDAEQARGLYREFYAQAPFVRVLPVPEGARIRGVAHTNDVEIGLHEVEGLDALVVTCAIDNLLKGAAGQALQNLNLMAGLPQQRGLPSRNAEPVGAALEVSR